MSATVPRHEVVLKQAAVKAHRHDLLAWHIGETYQFIGERTPEGTLAPGALYPERVGARVLVVNLMDEDIAPLTVQWPDGFRGMAEPGWLAPVGEEVCDA